MEIHPPEHGIHNWRDFLVHMATICLGLLIAIGLEQAVEALHHRHQRHQIEEDLQTETEQNRHILEVDLIRGANEISWLTTCLEALQTAVPVEGAIDLTVPPTPKIEGIRPDERSKMPSRSAWNVAKSSGLIELLPLPEAQLYDRDNYEADLAMDTAKIYWDQNWETEALYGRFNLRFEPGNRLHLTLAARDEFIQRFSIYLSRARYNQLRFAGWYGANQALLDHVRSVNEMFPYMQRANNQWDK